MEPISINNSERTRVQVLANGRLIVYAYGTVGFVLRHFHLKSYNEYNIYHLYTNFVEDSYIIFIYLLTDSQKYTSNFSRIQHNDPSNLLHNSVLIRRLL